MDKKLVLLFTFLATTGLAQTVFYRESFEAVPSASTYSANFFNSSSPNALANDYWDRVTNGFSATKHSYSTATGTITATHGSNLIIGEDIDDDGNPSGVGSNGFLRLQPVSIVGYTGVVVKVDIRTDGGTFEPPDFVELWVSTNGAASNRVVRWQGITGAALMTNRLGQSLATNGWGTYSIPTSGTFAAGVTSVAVGVKAKTTSGAEEIALDNVRYEGFEVASEETATTKKYYRIPF